MTKWIALVSGALLIGVASVGQAQATICKDGTSSSAVGRGACSQHGGVDAKATAAAKKAAKEAAKPQVTCTDGTTSVAGRGACSHHGGVAGSTSVANGDVRPSLPASVPASSPARTRSNANSHAPTATLPSSKRGEDNDPTGAIAQCKDGLFSHAANHRGACSKHGGVSKWLKP